MPCLVVLGQSPREAAEAHVSSRHKWTQQHQKHPESKGEEADKCLFMLLELLDSMAFMTESTQMASVSFCHAQCHGTVKMTGQFIVGTNYALLPSQVLSTL